MGFWLYYVLPLIISLIMIALTRWQKLAKIRTFLNIAALVFLVVALVFAIYVIIIDFKDNIDETGGIYIAMLVAMIAYFALAEFIKPNK